MPYAPGVQDRRGEFLAQGIGQAFDAIAGGIQQYGQNKLMAGQAIAKFEGAAAANKDMLQLLSNPDAPGAPKDAVKAFAKLQKDGTLGVRDAALLAQFAETYSKEKEETQRRAILESNLQAMRAQAQEAERQRNHLGQLQTMARLANGPAMVPNGNVPTSAQPAQGAVPTFMGAVQNAGGPGRGVLAAPVQRQMLQQMRDPMMNTVARAALATGQVPSANTAIADDQRRLVTEARSEVEAAKLAGKAEVEQAKLDAKNAGPKFHTDPTTGMVVAVYNGQMMPVRSPKEDDDYRAQLDDAVKNKIINDTERNEFWKGYLRKKAEWSPNTFQTIMQGVGGLPAATTPQQPAAAAAAAGPSFATVAEAEAARKAGKIKNGDKITVGGKAATWKD